MELGLSLEQKNILSQRMQLSVKILQMNALDLEQYIKESALENPLIELEHPEETDDPQEKRLQKLEWLDRMDESNSYTYVQNADIDEQDRISLYGRPEMDSLTDDLIQQIPGFKLPEHMEQVVRYIIGNLDDNGYLAISRQQMCVELGVNANTLEEALSVLHRMEPRGIGAEDLRECLLIQAKLLEGDNRILVEIIDKYLDSFAKNQLGKLARVLGVSLEEIKEARSKLLTLNPKPGNGYTSYNAIPYIRPDLFVVRFEGGYQIILNDYNQPRIEINRYYCNLAEQQGGKTAVYVNEQLNKAEWLVSCIQQRNNTILKCAKSLLQRQSRFFELGPGNLVPMVLSNVAEELDMHPSTISRAVRGKYLQCQWGVFCLSDFFSRSLNAAEEDLSQDFVYNQIQRIIDEEDPCKPYSDQAISNLLQERGVLIARRTVAKYREQLGIPHASGRKQF